LTRLFHPRRDRWEEHFSWVGCELVGSTDVGRTTIEVLRINNEESIALRRLLNALGVRKNGAILYCFPNSLTPGSSASLFPLTKQPGGRGVDC